MRLLIVAVFAAVLSLAPYFAWAAETSHGIAMHGDLKYPAGFKNFDYTNPNAPKGGTVRLTPSAPSTASTASSSRATGRRDWVLFMTT